MDEEKVIVGIMIALVVIGLIFEIYLCATYGNLPPDQVPSWVHWFILGR
jgi:hypothetical protein